MTENHVGEDWATWLGETDASLSEVKAVLRPDDDEGRWGMAPQTAKLKKPRDGGQTGLL